MAGSINLLFGVHNHQPVGNFDHVFREANQDCYRPFIETLYRYPQIKSTFHFSGSLVDWLLKNDPALLRKVKEMVKRQQVEILTGAYFEPILPLLPERDRLGQIKMLTSFIQDFFDCKPAGMWIGERVWEPYLSESIVNSGVQYILLDDFHFHCAGIKEKRLHGYYHTQVGNRNLAIFPISKKLRYIIPFSRPQKPISYLRALANEEGHSAVTIVDDGEKFGLWPGTHRWVYRERWLEKFFQLLIKNQAWLKTLKLGEYMQQHESLGLCHLPGCSYEEMMTWSGGKFKNFFVKYSEANNLHKRMLYVSEKIAKDKKAHPQALRHLYMSQSNCPYWHGVFGGVYLAHLRHFAYKNLIIAQSLLENRERKPGIEMEIFDFDQDGADEWIVKTPHFYIFIAPQQGGGIFEFDYKPKNINLFDTMTRRPEVYHKNIKTKPLNLLKLRKKKITNIHELLASKEKGLENFLIYDSYRRQSLLDHFLAPGLTLTDFKAMRYKELGDFIRGQYLIKKTGGQPAKSIILQRKGKLDYHNKTIPLTLTKKLLLNERQAQISFEYQLENLSSSLIDILFAVEFNLAPETESADNNLHYRGKNKDYVSSLKKDVEAKDITDIQLIDRANGIESALSFDQKTRLWAFPLQTISASEEGFERNYQQTVILPHWPVRLEKTWKAEITLTITSIS